MRLLLTCQGCGSGAATRCFGRQLCEDCARAENTAVCAFCGASGIVEQAGADCGERLSVVAPCAYAAPSVGLFSLAPLEASWPDDREVVCIAISMSGTTTGSILN